MTYNTVTKLYSVTGGGNSASSVSDGLSPSVLAQLTLFYYAKKPETLKTITSWNTLIHKNNSSNKPGQLITYFGNIIY